MRIKDTMQVILLIVFTLLLCIGVYCEEFLVTLPDDSGTLRAVAEDNADVVVFKGVRYAEPPVGFRRWKPPEEYMPPDPSVVRDATEFGNVCIQGANVAFDNKMSEDCLFLNIDVSANLLHHNQTSAPVAVLVFVHGGSYVRGAGLVYRGADAVNYWKGQVIVVTLEYRLNVFGFLGGEALRAQDTTSGSTGNYGLQDQRLALQWVQRNIAAFGGDPSRVTVMGESAGGGSVSNHLTMKKSWGLFASAIIESGSFSQWVCHTMVRAQESFDEVLTATGCVDVLCLLQIDAKTLFQVVEALPSYTVTKAEDLPYTPTADGVEIMTHPWLALAEGDVVDVPLLHGTNLDEGLMFTTLSRDATHAELLADWRDVYHYSPDEIAQLERIYGTQVYDPVPTVTRSWWQGQRSLGDKWFSCPAEYTSRQLAALPDRRSATFMYHFEHTAMMSHYVVHGSEMAYVFHWRIVTSPPEETYMADATSSYWGDFILDPSHDLNNHHVGLNALSQWPPYSNATGGDHVQILLEEGEISSENGLKYNECEFLIQYIDAAIRADFK